MGEVFLVNDSRGQNNWGCRATTSALVDLIRTAGADVVGSIGHMPHADLSPSSGVARLVKETVAGAPRARRLAHRAAAGWQGVRGPSRGFIRSLDDFERAAAAVDDGRLWSDQGSAIRRADTLIVNGEGAVYGRQLKGFISLFWAWYAKERHGRRVAFVNHTAELGDTEMRRAAEAVYPLLDDVSFRDPVSLRECGYAAPQASGGVVPDAAYRHEPLPLEQVQEWAAQPGFFSIWPYEAGSVDLSRPYIAVTGSSALNRPESADREASTRQFADLCEGLERIGLPIVLVAPDPTDADILGPIARERRLPLIAPSTPLPIAHQVLAQAACLVGGRWHPGILAATGGTPLVNMTANTRKTQGLLEQLGLDAPVFDASDLRGSIGAITELAASYIAGGDDLRTRIRARAAELRVQAGENVRVLTMPSDRNGTPSTADR